MFRFIILLIFNSSLTYSATLINRFKVPVYVSISTSIGYDENFLRLSPSDLIYANKFSSMISDSKSTNSMVNRNNIGLEYGPYLFKDHETRVKLNLSRNLYESLSEKSYNKYSLSISQHLGPYKWLKFNYSLMPDYYLRNYLDNDIREIIYFNNSEDIPPCISCKTASFSQEEKSIEYTMSDSRINKVWYSMYYSIKAQYYNENFNEFNLEIKKFKVGVSSKYSKSKKLGFKISYSIANNITKLLDQFSTANNDRGYNSTIINLSFSDRVKKSIINNYGWSFILENRNFTSQMTLDHLHYGRRDSDIKTSFWIDKRLKKETSIKIGINFRKKFSNSNYEFVEEIKSFSKYDIWVKYTFKTELLPY